jgi:hypothetical protein
VDVEETTKPTLLAFTLLPLVIVGACGGASRRRSIVDLVFVVFPAARYRKGAALGCASRSVSSSHASIADHATAIPPLRR